MPYEKEVPAEVATSIIDRLFETASAQVAPRSPTDLTGEEQVEVLTRVVEDYNEGQSKVLVSLESRDCPCGKCRPVSFALSYRTIH